jgi:hypothetical protein
MRHQIESHQDYKGIFSDRSQAFSTENFRRKRSSKNKCVSKSNNILLSESNNQRKPQLEILLMT